MEPLDERQKKSIDLVADLTRQIITLATAIIVVIITFFDKTSNMSVYNGSLKYVLCGYLFSVLSGVMTLMALAGTITHAAQINLYSRNISIPSRVQILSFLITTLAVVFLVSA